MSLKLIFALASTCAAGAQTPPPPNPDKPVDYAAWLNQQFAIPDERNAAAKYRQAVEALIPEPVGDNFNFCSLLNDGWNDEDRTKAAQLIEHNEKALALWREAAAMPGCRFPHKSEPRLRPDAPFAEMRTLIKLALLSMRLSLERGETEAALTELSAVQGTTRHIETHPGGATYIIALAYRKATYQALLRGVAALDAAPAKRLFASLHESDPPPGKHDKMLLSTTLDHYRSNQQYAVDEDRDGFLDCVRHPDSEPLPLPEGTTWQSVVSQLREYVANCARLLDQPDRPAALRTMENLDNPVLGEFSLPGLGAGEVRAYDWILGLHEQLAETLAYRSAVRIALACRIFHAEQGRWPRDLAEATRGEPADIRLDRFSGKDLGYRLTDDGPLIYSVNHDGRDDGGKWPRLGEGAFRHWTDEPGDFILWPLDYGRDE